jgi:surface polysaccharide O-acyltransferase-like enzyme
VKSLPALILLLATAVTQAMGMYRYSNDSLTMSGQVFFPILFVLMSAYIGFRASKTNKFSAVLLGLAGLGFILLILTGVGMFTDMYWFYPSTYMYYAALALLIITTALTIASVPKAAKVKGEDAASDASAKPAAKKASRRAPKKSRPTNLVAVSKSDSAQKEQ